MSYLIDANCIIRYLVNDQPKQAISVEKLLKSTKNLEILDVTIAEIVWVLTSHYRLSKAKICESINLLINLPNLKSNQRTILMALQWYEKYNIDYIDAYLAAVNNLGKHRGIYSFDLDFDKIAKDIRVKPLVDN